MIHKESGRKPVLVTFSPVPSVQVEGTGRERVSWGEPGGLLGCRPAPQRNNSALLPQAKEGVSGGPWRAVSLMSMDAELEGVTRCPRKPEEKGPSHQPGLRGGVGRRGQAWRCRRGRSEDVRGCSATKQSHRGSGAGPSRTGLCRGAPGEAAHHRTG